MVVIGLAWIVFWALLEVFAIAVIKAALVTGIIFVVAGLLLEGVPSVPRKP